ncbi:aspartate--ammonia ligase [Litoribacter ruber]|uniref:Aspartate--ammonia ligase n=1 Tax=Litoribacter ruber TaxID=702568 RepID=A0AAP2G621_9BACT|nr:MULTISPECIES: aspartate--ammonia ligase [Litoribacter]MBS9525203.1 aspartate--ammonia ligase [Litoribacter alkaliphilus]MBT0811689.1 aspartate--ammonia ligase [Litoribacter ruber]
METAELTQYKSLLGRLDTEEAIELVKTTFLKSLRRNLNLVKISSPLAIVDGTGINDDLNGIERPVGFPIKNQSEKKAVVVHSLAKWKRWQLAALEISAGKGIITDMRALRPDEDYSPIHSLYVDQWDWEKHIKPEERSIDYLKKTVTKIYQSIKTTELEVFEQYPDITPILPEELTFIHSEDLLAEYPDLSAKERETVAAKKYGAVFLIGIGGKLANGEPHDGRAPDYDDWTTESEDGKKGLNGDILVWNPILQQAFEISSMGVRVDAKALKHQLQITDSQAREGLLFHKTLLEGKLPESIGGGIGQSRLCMFLLRKTHIGEVQTGIWPAEEVEKCQNAGIFLM